MTTVLGMSYLQDHEFMQVENLTRVQPIPRKELQTNVKFDKVTENKKPELQDSGQKTNTLDPARSEKNGQYKPILSDAPNLYKQIGVIVSSNNTFLKLNRCDAAFWLMANYPNAYLLLNLIALRACRTACHPSGLEIGESYIGDYESIGCTRQKYRTALAVLVRMKFLKIIETCRNRKKSATGSTTVGTKVKLLNSEIWDINPELDNHQTNHRPTTDQPPINHEQEGKECKEVSNCNMSNSQARSTKLDKIFFNWEMKKLEGIEKSDLDEWTIAFPHVNIPEYLKFIEQDIGHKQTKYGKRKRIVQTVLIYLKNQNENQAAYKARGQNPNYQKPESLHNKKFSHDDRPVQYQHSITFT